MSEESTTPNPVERARRGLVALSRRDLDGFMGNRAPDAVLDLNAWRIGTFQVDEARAVAERLAEERG